MEYQNLRYWYLHEIRRLRAQRKVTGTDINSKRRQIQRDLAVLRKDKYMTEAAAVNATPTRAKTPRKHVPSKVAGHPLTARITLLSDKTGTKYGKDNNPKRKGSGAAKLFDLYTDGMTIGDFLNAGGRGSAVKYDLAHNYISVA